MPLFEIGEENIVHCLNLLYCNYLSLQLNFCCREKNQSQSCNKSAVFCPYHPAADTGFVDDSAKNGNYFPEKNLRPDRNKCCAG